MSVHIGAQKGDVAETVLLPGDPLRAKFIAETYLDNPVCYNKVRGMYGYTGSYQGKRVSVQGTGMGMPSASIYANELIREFGVENLIRVGTCGSISAKAEIRDIILGLGACHNSKINDFRFRGMSFAPTADFELLYGAYNLAKERGLNVKVGAIFSSDSFYADDPELGWKIWNKYGVLAVEMEAAELYTLAAQYDVKALAIVTVSDELLTRKITTSEEREKTFTDMIQLALDLAGQLD